MAVLFVVVVGGVDEAAERVVAGGLAREACSLVLFKLNRHPVQLLVLN